MPELPEVETTRKGITPNIANQCILAVNIYNGNLRWPIDPKLSEILKDDTINSVERRSKYLLVNTFKGTLILHLGMSGSLRVVPNDTPRKKHDHFELILANNKALRLNDPRRFGAVLWHAIGDGAILTHSLLKNLAPEPLSDEFNTQYLTEKLANKNTNIKTAIMDNKIVVGVGNIYASESLFMAKIQPEKKANTLTKKQISILVNSIKDVLSKAIKAGGTTLKDFTQPDGQPGYFEQELQVYGKEGLPCPICNTNIRKVIIGQRASFYCPKCQN